jgi:hypothetical protein
MVPSVIIDNVAKEKCHLSITRSLTEVWHFFSILTLEVSRNEVPIISLGR